MVPVPVFIVPCIYLYLVLSAPVPINTIRIMPHYANPPNGNPMVGFRFIKPENRQYYEFNTSKLRSLGMKFKSLEEMFDDTVASLMEQGHLSP